MLSTEAITKRLNTLRERKQMNSLYTQRYSLSLSLPPTPLPLPNIHERRGLRGQCLIDCFPGITFQTINTIKNPLKPLKPQQPASIYPLWIQREENRHRSDTEHNHCLLASPMLLYARFFSIRRLELFVSLCFLGCVLYWTCSGRHKQSVLSALFF